MGSFYRARRPPVQKIRTPIAPPERPFETGANRAIRRCVRHPHVCGPVRRVAVSGMAAVALTVTLAAWPGAAAASAEEESHPDPAQDSAPPPERSTEEGVAGELGFLAAPPFPELAITEAVRMRLETFGAPDASVGSGHVSLVRPQLSARATWFASERILSRIGIQLVESHYDFSGTVWGTIIHPFSGQPIVADRLIGDLDLHAARVALDGAYRLSDQTHWLAQDERWSLIGSLFGGSRWENSEFDSGLAGGGAVGFGYEIPKRLRIALGVSVGTPIEDASAKLNPLFHLRWRPTDRIAVRSRELGLQAEFALTPVLGVYLTGFRSSDGYRLRDRDRLGDLSFRDRYLRFGGGIDWTLANWLSLELEGGAITSRKLRVHEEHLGTLLSEDGDPSAFYEVRFEVRL